MLRLVAVCTTKNALSLERVCNEPAGHSHCLRIATLKNKTQSFAFVEYLRWYRELMYQIIPISASR